MSLTMTSPRRCSAQSRTHSFGSNRSFTRASIAGSNGLRFTIQTTSSITQPLGTERETVVLRQRLRGQPDARYSGPRPIALASTAVGHQGESESGPVGDEERCGGDDCALGCGGFGCWTGAACWDEGGGVDDIFCLMSSATACNVAMLWANCSCLAAS